MAPITTLAVQGTDWVLPDGAAMWMTRRFTFSRFLGRNALPCHPSEGRVDYDAVSQDDADDY
ncbi:MAG: hypothetical protein IKU22_03070 [Alistipes sp.]|nr:hypothetical protein [Alistipes sp.]